MKNLIFKTIMIVAVGMLLFISCDDKNTEDITYSDLISEDDAISLIESDDISDEIDDVIGEFLIDDFSFVNKEAVSKDVSTSKNGKPECAVKTIEIDFENKIVTIDFGEGCELKNGRVLSGKIIMAIEIDSQFKIKMITQTYENFMVDDVSVTGESIITRIRENEAGNPETTISFNKTLTWPDGEKITRVGEKMKEWIEGNDNKEWGDNVYLIWGDWTSTFKNGSTCATTINKEEALRREFSCRFIVSGIANIDKNGKTASINFGDGDCDNLAIYADENGEKEITLRKRKRN